MSSRPLVYAPERVLERSQSLLPRGVILENAIAAAIERGDVTANEKGGVVFLDEHQLVARVVRGPGKRRARPRAWYVQSIEANRNTDLRQRNQNAHKAA